MENIIFMIHRYDYFIVLYLSVMNNDFRKILFLMGKIIIGCLSLLLLIPLGILMLIFSKINGNQKINVEIAIACYENALKIFTQGACPSCQASAQNNLGIAYRQRIKGDKAKNLEQAILCYQNALQIRTQEDFPVKWARTQNNLGNVYRERIIGDKAENLEKAIVCFKNALKIRTHNKFPVDWAQTKNNLGNVYGERIIGDKAENIEKAILCYQNALQIYTKENYPIKWAHIKNNLAIVYVRRIKEDKAENIEKAISIYKNILQIFTVESFPEKWAGTQNNLGNAYRERIKKDKAENLEEAIICYKNALQIHTYINFSVQWANVQTNLAATYIERIQENKAENIEKAIACSKNTLQIYSEQTFPIKWAGTQNILAVAYIERIQENKAENIEKAIACSKNALKIFTKDAFPLNWASTQNNLGNAYRYRTRGNIAKNLEQAILSFQKALLIFTKGAFPLDWAATQNNLASAYWDRIKENKSGDFKQVIGAYRNSLQIQTPENFPIECLIDSRNLGNLGFEQENWQIAIEGYSQAVKAIENLRIEALSEVRRQEIMAEAIEVYQNIVQSHINLGHIERAIEYAERSKTRDLVELLANRDLYPKGDIEQSVIDELDRLRREIVTESKQLANQEINLNNRLLSSNNNETPQQTTIDRTKLNQLKQQLDKLIEEKITPKDPNFQLTQKVETISYHEIQKLIEQNTAIVEWYITKDRILTFIITKNKKPIVIESSSEDLQGLIENINNYLDLYKTKNDNWQQELPSLLTKFAEYLHLDEIIAEIDDRYQSLILIPHRFIHLLPIHCLPIGETSSSETKYLMDLFPRGVKYAPSCQLLQLVTQQEKQEFNNLFAIQNPSNAGDDLPFANIEVETIGQLFVEPQILDGDRASKETLLQEQLNETQYLHFSTHGTFNFQQPLRSALLLANSSLATGETTPDLDQCLTLGEIFDLDLRQCHLVTLSACETGIADLNSVSDEYISLPSGFLFAGSFNVVSSLWEVDPISTALLMIKFYQNHVEEKSEITPALNKAQEWLREITKKQLNQWISDHKIPLDNTLKVQLKRDFRKLSDDDRPFENPYHWGGFCAIGK